MDWSKDYEIVAWMDSNEHRDKYSSHDAILAISEQTDKSSSDLKNIDELSETIDKKKDWLFGYFSYDIKNEIEVLSSDNFDGLYFPELFFFSPEKLITIKDGQLNFLYLNEVAHQIDKDFAKISALSETEAPKSNPEQSVRIKMRIHKDAYFEKAQKFLDHIHRGDIYEANFCQEFYAEDTTIDPLETYRNLNHISEPPFATYLKIGDNHLLCASPERYLKKQGQTVISQPIKGTAARGETAVQDEELQLKLGQDEKERAENIMITDLVRNDLSKSAVKGSVEVDELCKVYSFKQVHQMISTVTAEVSKDTKPLDLIKQTFPMGSMTCAPKISALTLMEELEETKRGLSSGTVCYLD
ncbi:MAG: chorismate-binding protein, partial [Allomuricauda sp.]